MVIGVGSDYAIYMVHRVREGAGVGELAATARAVVLSALTTIVGFGTLVTTHYPGLRSMGWMASLGVLFAVFAAVVAGAPGRAPGPAERPPAARSRPPTADGLSVRRHAAAPPGSGAPPLRVWSSARPGCFTVVGCCL